MKITTKKITTRELLEKADSQELRFHHTTKSPNIKSGDFEDIVGMVCAGIFPQGYDIHAIGFGEGKGNLHHSSEIVSLFINFARGSLKLQDPLDGLTIGQLEPLQRERFLGYQFSLTYLSEYEDDREAFEYMDSIQRLKYL